MSNPRELALLDAYRQVYAMVASELVALFDKLSDEELAGLLVSVHGSAELALRAVEMATHHDAAPLRYMLGHRPALMPMLASAALRQDPS